MGGVDVAVFAASHPPTTPGAKPKADPRLVKQRPSTFKGIAQGSASYDKALEERGLINKGIYITAQLDVQPAVDMSAV